MPFSWTDHERLHMRALGQVACLLYRRNQDAEESEIKPF